MLELGSILFDKYRIERVIGRGGMANVFQATHLNLGESVAIKVLMAEMAARPGVVERFLREARAAARLRGEHVARVTDVGTLPWGLPYMVIEYLEGVDLAHVLRARGLLTAPEAVDHMLQACEALAEAHAAGIVHRDLKPSNFFLTHRPDGSPLLKLLDFGISKVSFEEEESLLTRDSVIGTPSYMSPEQLRGSHDVDARSDIWSLGIMLYECLGGARPFRAESLSALAIKAATEPTPMLPPLQPLPPGLDGVIYRCLDKQLDRRFQSVAELALALAPYAGNQRAAATIVERTLAILRVTPLPMLPPPRPPGPPAPPTHPTTLGSSVGMVTALPPAGRSRLGWIVGGGVIVGVVAAMVVLATSGGPEAAGVTPAAVPMEPTPPAGAASTGVTATPIEPADGDEPAAPATPPPTATDHPVATPTPAPDEPDAPDAPDEPATPAVVDRDEPVTPAVVDRTPPPAASPPRRAQQRPKPSPRPAAQPTERPTEPDDAPLDPLESRM